MPSGEPTPVPALLDEREQAVMDHISLAMQGIKELGLRRGDDGELVNGGELVAAVHVLQSFVIQHMLQRVAPGHWGNWFDVDRSLREG